MSDSHKIEVDLTSVPPQLRSYLDEVFHQANAAGVQIWLSDQSTVPYNDNSQCNGFFVDEPKPRLAVGCGQPIENWFLVFLHESGHMDQWVKKSPYWDAGKIRGIEAVNLLDLWIDGMIELTETQKWPIVRAAREVELDCERRAVEKIGEYNLPIDPTHYAQRANAYVYYYNMIGWHRKWYSHGREPYNNPDVYKAMPTQLGTDLEYEPAAMSTTIYDALHSCI